jgi:hypothetical protein
MSFKQKLFCNTCRRPTNHNTIEENGIQFKRVVPRVRTNERQFKNMEDIYYLAQCLGCDSIKLVTEFHYEQEGQWNSMYHIYPDPTDRLDKLQHVSFRNLPESIFLFLSEVQMSYLNKLFILCSVGLRMLIEAICIDKNVQGKLLIDKINKLNELGYITQLQTGVLHQIRLLGNKSAHEIVDQDDELVLEGLNVIHSLLFNIYGLENTKIYDKDIT